MPTESFPRGPLLYKRGLVLAHRTSSVDGSPAELWERDPVEIAIARDSNMRGRVDLDARLDAVLVDFGRVAQAHPLQCFGHVAHASPTEVVIAAPPWVQLSTLIARAPGQLATGFVITWLRQVAAELATVPVVLRGLTPHTLAMTVTGGPRILDLSLAQYPGCTDGHLPGAIIGKLIPYMSPEQTKGEQLDGRRDVWALAAIAVELLTGERLFQADTDYDTLTLIRHEYVHLPPPLHARPKVVVKLLETLLETNLAKRMRPADVVAAIDRGFAVDLWNPTEMFDEVRRLAPDDARTAIEYGY